MTLMPGILLAYATAHAFSGLMAAFLFMRMRAPQYVAFGVLALSVSVYCAAASQILVAPSPAVAAPWLTLEFISGAIAFGALTHYAHLMTGAPSRRVVRWVDHACIVGVPMTVAGFFIDPGMTLPSEHGFLSAHPHFLPSVTPALYVYTLVAMVLGVAVLTGLFRAARRNADARFLSAAMVVLMLGLGVDAALVSFRVLSHRFAYHLASASALLCAYLLLHRFVHTVTALSVRTHELRMSYDELAHVQEELVRKEQLAAVGELSAVIAHEVKSPLSVIRSAAAGLRAEGLSSDSRTALLGVLDEENDRLNRLVRDLLTYARPVEPQTKSFGLEPILRSAIKRASPAKGVKVEFDLEYAPDLLEGDADLLERAFLNIVENALEAMPRGGTLGIQVALAVHNERPAVALRFSDNGEGMDTMIRAHATDPFFTTRPEGTGLGLAIVERIVRAHGGVVTLESGSRGSVVSVLLPARAPSERP